MFIEWVSAGAIFGVKAFFAIIAFALCAAAVLGVIMMVTAIVKAGGANHD